MARCRSRLWPRATRKVAELAKAGVPDDLARRIASLAVLKAAPDIVLVADRAKKPVGEVTATYFATEAFFQLDRVAGAVPGIVVSDYFDRLALDRALDSIGDAERRLTAAMVGNGVAGAGAVDEWIKPRQAEVERIRAAIHEIAGSGLTLVEAVGGGEPAGRSGARVDQCRKCRMPVNTIATLCSSAAAITSSSLHRAAGLDHRGGAGFDRDQ